LIVRFLHGFLDVSYHVADCIPILCLRTGCRTNSKINGLEVGFNLVLVAKNLSKGLLGLHRLIFIRAVWHERENIGKWQAARVAKNRDILGREHVPQLEPLGSPKGVAGLSQTVQARDLLSRA
jgi:hypothetical protein